MFRRLFGIGLLAGVAGFAIIGGLVLANVLTYRALTAETEVAALQVAAEGPDRYRVTLAEPDGAARQFRLSGQEWQLDARIIKWQPWVSLLGHVPLYRLERISGRYREIDDARNLPRTAHALSENPGLDLWALARDRGHWLPGVDAAYGSAVYLPLEDGADYRISLSASGLIARPVSASGRRAVGSWN